MKRARAIARMGASTTLGLLLLVACGEKPAAPAPDGPAAATARADTAAPAETAAKPADKARIWTGDLDAMIERRLVRILVPYSKTFYFLDKGEQRGGTYELGVEFEKSLNHGNKDRARPIRVIFIPTSRDQLLPALIEGRGDIAAGNLTITPERLATVDFSAPLGENVSEILATAANAAAPTSADGLTGATVYVRRSSSYFASLTALNSRLKSLGKKPVNIVPADENLEDEDILEMVNAGIIPATVVDSHIGEFWVQVFDGIKLHPQVVLRDQGQIGWAIRRGSPQLRAAVDAFVAKNRVGTLMGNVILQRYFKSTKWVKNATAESEMKRFASTTELFKKYAGQYDFDWLLIMAQAFQESGLDQSTKSPVGAVGIMQVMPTTAGDKNVAIRDIHLLEPNVHAGVKYLRFLVNQYFDEPGINATNRHLFAFAAYNGGPNRIARLRKEAAAAGLDPNVWFNNVELLAAKDIGRETVQYVSNIYKYYVAYKLVFERTKERDAAKNKAA